MAGRRRPVPDLEDDHRRDPRPRAGRPPRAALAPHRRRVAIRHRRPGQRHAVRLARPLPDRDAGKGRRRLHPPGLRPLDRERRRQAVPGPDRLQHRPLRGHRPVAVDRRQPGLRARRPTSASRRRSSRSSRANGSSSPRPRPGTTGPRRSTRPGAMRGQPARLDDDATSSLPRRPGPARESIAVDGLAFAHDSTGNTRWT